MKRTVAKLVNLLMACIVLLSSTGFGLVEHSCHVRGKRVALITQEVACKGCPAEQHAPAQTPVVKKTDCCQEEQRFENVDVTSSLSQLVAKLIKSITEGVATGLSAVLAWVIDWIFSAARSETAAVTLEPPSPSGRELLTLVQRFLI